jgi:hypothetical protein
MYLTLSALSLVLLLLLLLLLFFFFHLFSDCYCFHASLTPYNPSFDIFLTVPLSALLLSALVCYCAGRVGRAGTAGLAISLVAAEGVKERVSGRCCYDRE